MELQEVARAFAYHRSVREVERGVWHREAPHPDWAGPEDEAFRQRLPATAETPNEAARGLVSSYAIDDGDRLLLFDPLAVPREIVELAAGREPVVVLTSPWHERDTRSLVERLDAPVFTPPPDEGTPDVAWLLGRARSDAHLYSAGDRLPVGVEAREHVANGLEMLLDLPVEVILATHGGPTDGAALGRALA